MPWYKRNVIKSKLLLTPQGFNFNSRRWGAFQNVATVFVFPWHSCHNLQCTPVGDTYG